MNSTITLIKTIDRPIRKHKKVDLSASCLPFFLSLYRKSYRNTLNQHKKKDSSAFPAHTNKVQPLCWQNSFPNGQERFISVCSGNKSAKTWQATPNLQNAPARPAATSSGTCRRALRRTLEYSAASTRVLSAKYDSGLRTPPVRLHRPRPPFPASASAGLPHDAAGHETLRSGKKDSAQSAGRQTPARCDQRIGLPHRL